MAIQGRVVDRRGDPVAFASIEVLSKSDTGFVKVLGRPVQARSDGTFCADELKPVTYVLLVRATRSLDTSDRVLAPARIEGVAAGADDVRVVLQPSMLIKGRTVDSNGRPLKDALVRALDMDDIEVAKCLSKEDGSFALEARLGELVKLVAKAPNYGEGDLRPLIGWFGTSIEVSGVFAGADDVVIEIPDR
jgi:hypothetical protein